MLAKTLLATQRVVHLLAMAARCQRIGQRARVTQDVERAFPVLCVIPQAGLYVAPISIGEPLAGLVSDHEAGRVSSNFDTVLAAAEAGDVVASRQAVPDARWREP